MDTELRAFIAEHGLGCRMPTSRELRAAGANALDVAVIHHGGYHVFGERLQCVHPASVVLHSAVWGGSALPHGCVCTPLNIFTPAFVMPPKCRM